MKTYTREQLKASEQKYIDAAEYYWMNRRMTTVWAVADERGLRRERLQTTVDMIFHFRAVCQ